MAELEREAGRFAPRNAPIKPHINNAGNAISVGNVNMWLDCYADEEGEFAWWNGLRRDTKPFFVIKVSVCSRFLYGLLFTNMKQVEFKMDIDVDPKKESITTQAMLIESQSDWTNINEMPRESTSYPHIQPLWLNQLYFRFGEIDNDVRNKIISLDKTNLKPRLSLTPSWKLKTVDDKEVGYLPTKPIVVELKPFSNLFEFIRDQRGIGRFSDLISFNKVSLNRYGFSRLLNRHSSSSR